MEFFTNLFWNRVLYGKQLKVKGVSSCILGGHLFSCTPRWDKPVRSGHRQRAAPFPIFRSLCLANKNAAKTRDPNHAIDASVRMSSLMIPVDHLWPKCEVILFMSIVNGWKDFPTGLAEDFHGKCCFFCLTDGDLYVASWIVFLQILVCTE